MRCVLSIIVQCLKKIALFFDNHDYKLLSISGFIFQMHFSRFGRIFDWIIALCALINFILKRTKNWFLREVDPNFLQIISVNARRIKMPFQWPFQPFIIFLIIFFWHWNRTRFQCNVWNPQKMGNRWLKMAIEMAFPLALQSGKYPISGSAYREIDRIFLQILQNLSGTCAKCLTMLSQAGVMSNKILTKVAFKEIIVHVHIALFVLHSGQSSKQMSFMPLKWDKTI